MSLRARDVSTEDGVRVLYALHHGGAGGIRSWRQVMIDDAGIEINRGTIIGGTCNSPSSTTPMSLPPEIVDLIIDLVDNYRALQACSLVAKGWVYRSRKNLFRTVVLFTHHRWQNAISVGDASPAGYVRTLSMVQGITPPTRWINTDKLYPFLPHLRDFKNVENLVISGWAPSRFSEGGLKKYFGPFGGKLRSLELGGERMTPDSFLVFLGLFPNLEDLSVQERVVGEETTRVLTVSPKFSGRLTVCAHSELLVKTLCKLPLRFREICLQDHKCDSQELIDACAETLVDFRATSGDYGKHNPVRYLRPSILLFSGLLLYDVSFERCSKLHEVTIVEKSIQNPRSNLLGIVSSITSRHIQRIVIGFRSPVTNAKLRFAVESGAFQKIDGAITRLAKQTLNHGRKLQLEFHVCGNPSIGLFDLIFPRFLESGCLKVTNSSYVSKGSILYLPLLSRRNNNFW